MADLRDVAGLRGVAGFAAAGLLAPAAGLLAAADDAAALAGPAVRPVVAGLAAPVSFGVAERRAVAGLAAAGLAALAGLAAVVVFVDVLLVVVDLAAAGFGVAALVERRAAAVPDAGLRAAGRRRATGLAAGADDTVGGRVLIGETASTAWIAAVPTARAAPPVVLAAAPAAEAAVLASLPASAATSWAASPACFDRLATCFRPLVACAPAS